MRYAPDRPAHAPPGRMSHPAQPLKSKRCETCGFSAIPNHQCPPPIPPQYWVQVTKRQTTFDVASVRCPLCRVASESEVDRWGVIVFHCDDCHHKSVYRLSQWRRINPPVTTRDGPPVTEADTRGT